MAAKLKKSIEIVDLDAFDDFLKQIVKVNDRETDLLIGDKIYFPEESKSLKTIVAITIFEDGQVNYMLKWFEDNEFQALTVSMTDLKLLKYNRQLKLAIGLQPNV